MDRDREAGQEPATVVQVRDGKVMNPVNGGKSCEESRGTGALEDKVHITLASMRCGMKRGEGVRKPQRF